MMLQNQTGLFAEVPESILERILVTKRFMMELLAYDSPASAEHKERYRQLWEEMDKVQNRIKFALERIQLPLSTPEENDR
jgi:hypothetical protein